LSHPDTYGWPDSSSVTGNWWDYPTVGLNDVDRQRLAANRASFFTLTLPPPTPVNVSTAVANASSITVSWTDNSTAETGFKISNGVTSTTVAANTTSYTWTGLKPGQYMCFGVSAFNAAGTSAQSPWSCQTIPNVPTTPTGVVATPASGTSVKVSWAAASNTTGYRISNGVTSTTVGASATSYTWSGLSQGQYMCFGVSAYNASGSSPQSPWACTTTPTVPASPSKPVATALSATEIKVTWTDNSNNENGFQVYNGVSYLTVGANSTSALYYNLSPGTYMCFQVTAYNLAGSSAPTSYACTTTPH
jgi:hypothetical protein